MAWGLTGTQKRVLGFIAEHAATKGYSPTLIEIARHIGARSPTAALDHVGRLVAKGMLTRGPKHVARTFVLTASGREELGLIDAETLARKQLG
jgi:SOS-response transcriptional repressor LexA